MLVSKVVIFVILLRYDHAFQPPMAANARVPGYVECFVKCLAMLSQMLHYHGMLKIQRLERTNYGKVIC